MTIISYCHIHKKVTNVRITKSKRLIFRVFVSVILACLPLADHLTSLSLIGITCALFLVVLILDIFGNSCPGERFFTGGIGRCPETRCKYTARLKMGRKRKAELQKRLVEGEGVSLEDALKRSRTDSIGSETTLEVGEEWHGAH